MKTLTQHKSGLSRVCPFVFSLLLAPNAFAVDAGDDSATLSDNEKIAQQKQRQFEQQVNDCVKVLEGTGIVETNDKLVYRYCESKIIAKQSGKLGRYAKRVLAERATELNPFVITPHEPSYIMPITYTNNFNYDAYRPLDEEVGSIDPETGEFSSAMEAHEAKYQVSFKVPLRSSSLFVPGDAIYFAMTIQAWWQLYSDEISKPFRETNYKPEIFYIAPLPWQTENGSFGYFVSFEHQSNGQVQGLSRSWNRIHLGLIYDTDTYSIGIKPWYRLPEDEKDYALQPDGDDNPDIDDYLGNYEILGAYAFNNDHKLSGTFRQNWRTGNGSIELNYTFPLPFSSRLMGFAQFFSGYGESLIDYNHRQEKIGVGIALTDVF